MERNESGEESRRLQRPSLMPVRTLHNVFNPELPSQRVKVILTFRHNGYYNIQPTCCFKNWASLPLPSGVEAYKDCFERMFYIDRNEQTTNWERPSFKITDAIWLTTEQ